MMMRNESDAESKESDNEIRARSVSLEQGYVHEVYDRIADDLSSVPDEHRSPVQEFLEGLEPGSLVADVGCGDGRYLNVKESVFTLGLDYCPNLLKQARTIKNQSDVVEADNLSLPYRNAAIDAVISVSVIHHFATRERRILALRELARILRIGGKLLIIVQDDHLKCESSDVLIPWYKAPKRKESNDALKTSSHNGKVDASEMRNFRDDDEDDDDDDDDDVSVPSSDEEDALVPDDYWMYSSVRLHRFSQNGASSDTFESISKMESNQQASASVESCYGFVRNVLRRFSSQPTPSVLANEDFPYTIAKDVSNLSEPTSPIKHQLTSDTVCQSSTSTRNIDSIIKNDIIELRNIDDHLETKIGQSSCESYTNQPSSAIAQEVASPAVSESSKELVRSLSGFFKKLPSLWNKRNSLPADSSSPHDHTNHKSLTSDSELNSELKLVRSKTTATCTLNFESYSHLESVEEDDFSDSEDERYQNRKPTVLRTKSLPHRKRKEKSPEIEFTKDDIVNGNMQTDIDSFYSYRDGNYFVTNEMPQFEETQNSRSPHSKTSKKHSSRYFDIKYEAYPVYFDSSDGEMYSPKRTPQKKSKLSHKTQNLNLEEEEYPVLYDPCEKLISTQNQIDQTFFNSLIYQDDFPSTGPRESEFIDEDPIMMDTIDKPIKNKRTMNDDIEEVYGHLKTLKFDEWSGSPKRCKRTSYPNYQMVQSKTLGPFYDSDEDIEDQDVVLSSYYSMPELCKLADYYQDYIFPNKNYVEQSSDIDSLNTLNNPIIAKDSLGNFIIDDVSKLKMINFEKEATDLKKFNGLDFQRNLSHRKLSDLVELQEENAAILESEDDTKSIDDAPLAESQISFQDHKDNTMENISAQEATFVKTDKVENCKHRYSLLLSASTDDPDLDDLDGKAPNEEKNLRPTNVVDSDKCCSYVSENNNLEDVQDSSEMTNSGEEVHIYGPHESKGSSVTECPEFLSHGHRDIGPHLAKSTKANENNVVNISCSSAFPQLEIADLQEDIDDFEACSHSEQRTNYISKDNKEFSSTDNCEVSFPLVHPSTDLPLARSRLNNCDCLFDESADSLSKTDLSIPCIKQSELISVDELFSFDDVYSDLKHTYELGLDTTNASRSPDHCLKNCELSQRVEVDSINQTKESQNVLNAKSACEDLWQSDNELKNNLLGNINSSESINSDYVKTLERGDQLDEGFSESEKLRSGMYSDISCRIRTKCNLAPSTVDSLQTDSNKHCTNLSSTDEQTNNLKTNTKDSTPVHSLHGHLSNPNATLDTHRYFHLFQENELEQFIEEYVEDLHVLRSFKHQFSRCVIAEKVQVWTI